MHFSINGDYSSLLNSSKYEKSGPMLNDCFFGNEGCEPLLTAKRPCKDFPIVAPQNNQENVFFGCESSWSPNGECNQFCNEQSSGYSPQMTELKSSSRKKDCWIEEWMDLNGIFDPSVEVSCFDIDLSTCQPQSDLDDAGSLHSSSSSDFGFEQSYLQECMLGTSPSTSNSVEVCPDANQFFPSPINEGSVKSDSEEIVLTSDHKRESFPKVFEASTSSLEAPESFHENYRSPTYRTITERKREQNRTAALRYREKRRKEAEYKKEELRELELRNVALKTELSGLTTEIGYLKKLLHDVIGK